MGNKKYDKEFKLEAISLAMEPGNSAWYDEIYRSFQDQSTLGL